jgi:hypothetical protein
LVVAVLAFPFILVAVFFVAEWLLVLLLRASRELIDTIQQEIATHCEPRSVPLRYRKREVTAAR